MSITNDSDNFIIITYAHDKSRNSIFDQPPISHHLPSFFSKGTSHSCRPFLYLARNAREQTLEFRDLPIFSRNKKKKKYIHYVATSSFDAVRTERKFRKKFIFTRLRTLTGTNLYKVTDVAQLIELDSLNFEECERCEAIFDLYLCNEHLYISSKQFSCYRSRYSVRR